MGDRRMKPPERRLRLDSGARWYVGVGVPFPRGWLSLGPYKQITR